MTLHPLSLAQEQLWFIDEFHHGLPAHNVPYLIRLRGDLDVSALERALTALIARHEPLRTRLVAGQDGHPVQVIDPPEPVKLDVENILPERLREEADAESLRPFHLAEDHPLRTRLLHLADRDHVLLTVAHLTAFDDWSLRVLLSDLTTLYRAETAAAEAGGQPCALPELPVRFADLAAAERERLQGPTRKALEDHWRGALAGLETSRFPADHPRPRLADHTGAVETALIYPAVLSRLRGLSRDAGTALPVTLLAALQVLLHRYTGQTDLITGALIGPERGNPELIAFLERTLPVRADASGDPTFAELLTRVHAALADARAHQHLPFAAIVEALPIERDPGSFPVFQTGFTYTEPVPETINIYAERPGLRASVLDLRFLAEPRPDGLFLEASYTPALFDAATVRRLLGNLAVLLAGAVADPQARLSRLPLLTPAELQAELRDWNNTAADLPVQCIHEGFQDRVAAAPAAIAAEYEGTQVSYADLDRWATQVAARLRALGVGPEVLVGVCMRTGLARLAALLGVWQAGGGYVPLDPALPPDRLSFMIADTGMAAIVTDKPSAASVPATDGVAVLPLDDEPEPGQPQAVPATAKPDNVAYVIYTSGSTGQPKGVLVEHRQAINFLHGMARHWRIGPDSAVLGFAAFTFDVSVMDMFMPLLGGARLVLAAPQTLHSPPRLAALIRDRHVTFACLPPAVLNLLRGEKFPELRTLLSAGEELSSELLRAWQHDGLEIYNGYGPTEASIGSTFAKLEPSTPLPPPIGRPKPNYQAYVLDPHLNPVPVGVTGELHIGGAGVARGYLNRPELTQERFIPDPFRPGQRLYKTGDLVRRRPDGTIVFAGRIDNQVKIRGLRVEPGEIEAALVAHPGIAQAVVTVVTAPSGEKQLVGYLRPSGDAAPEISEIRQHLARTLPAYMIPTHLIPLAELPLTAHKKIDKAALPPPDSVGTRAQRVPPRTALEAVLTDLYATVLGTQQVGVTDGFFDAGGSSLQAMQLVTQLRTVLDADLDVAAVFLTPTPRQLAGLLRDKHGFTDEEYLEEDQAC
jgi:amino acid adenylation domain-containing protein